MGFFGFVFLCFPPALFLSRRHSEESARQRSCDIRRIWREAAVRGSQSIVQTFNFGKAPISSRAAFSWPLLSLIVHCHSLPTVVSTHVRIGIISASQHPKNIIKAAGKFRKTRREKSQEDLRFHSVCSLARYFLRSNSISISKRKEKKKKIRFGCCLSILVDLFCPGRFSSAPAQLDQQC